MNRMARWRIVYSVTLICIISGLLAVSWGQECTEEVRSASKIYLQFGAQCETRGVELVEDRLCWRAEQEIERQCMIECGRQVTIRDGFPVGQCQFRELTAVSGNLEDFPCLQGNPLGLQFALVICRIRATCLCDFREIPLPPAVGDGGVGGDGGVDDFCGTARRAAIESCRARNLELDKPSFACNAGERTVLAVCDVCGPLLDKAEAYCVSQESRLETWTCNNETGSYICECAAGAAIFGCAEAVKQAVSN
jgi:hypothetical protein